MQHQPSWPECRYKAVWIISQYKEATYSETLVVLLKTLEQAAQMLCSYWYLEVCVRREFFGQCEHIIMQVCEAAHSRFDGTTLSKCSGNSIVAKTENLSTL